jgi:hypothetical protein
MHPRKEVLEAPAVLDAVAEAAAELDVLVADGALDELLPHAASSRLVAAAAAAVINAVCLTVSSTGPGCRSPGITGLPPGPDCPRVRPVRACWEEPRRHCGHVVAESRSENVL